MTILQAPRLDRDAFNLDVEKLRRGTTSDKYFNRTQAILLHDDHHPKVLMQVFQKGNSVLCGVDKAIAILRCGAGHYDGEGIWSDGFDKLVVRALHDGDAITSREPVLTIEGDYSLFAHLETQYLGALARATNVATNTRAVVNAAGDKQVLFFAARFDEAEVQATDGYAALVGGASAVSTDEGGALCKMAGVGTMPHGLIAAYGGNTVLASLKYAEKFPDELVSPLVDFTNDCAPTALACAVALEGKLHGVRLDTSETNVDEGVRRVLAARFSGDSLDHALRQNRGVCLTLVSLVRQTLDEAGYPDVKIIVSGGFEPVKIKMFESAGAAVDVYGVGASLLKGSTNFTADIVQVDGVPCAKVGRQLTPTTRLVQVY